MKLCFSPTVRSCVGRYVFLSLLLQTIMVPLSAAQPQTKSKTETVCAIENHNVSITSEEYHGINLKKIITTIVQRAEKQNMLDDLPEGIIRCYTQLNEGADKLPCKYLEQALPLISAAVVGIQNYKNTLRTVKSIRPREGDTTIVGAAGCDVTQILRNLAKLKTIMCDKFEQTWTIIENINVTTQVDVSKIFTAIQESTETACEKFEETWTMLEQLEKQTQQNFSEFFTALNESTIDTCKKFEQTWTIIENIDLSVETDLSKTFTALEQTSQIICEKFEETWTVLENLKLSAQITEFGETYTAIQESTEQLCDKFEEIWTMLEDVQISGTITDITQVFTAIKESTGILCDKFEETWTMLADVSASGVITDIGTVFTAIKESTETACDKFEEIWTMLANIQSMGTTELAEVFTAINGATESACDKFEEIWTMLADVEAMGSIELGEVFTVIKGSTKTTCDKFEETWTMLENIQIAGTITDIGEVFTAINGATETACDKFEEIWTMLANVTASGAITDIGTVFTAISESTEKLCDKFEETWTIIEGFSGSPCAPTPLFQSDVAAGVLTIATPGVYCLAENISGRIVIDADRVTLNLNGKQISSSTTNSISSTGHSNITIKDGFLNGNNTTNTGLDLTNCTNIKVLCVDFKDSATNISLDSVSTIIIDTCFFSTNHPAANLRTIDSTNSHTGMITNCKIKNVNNISARYYGISLRDSFDFIVERNQMSNILADVVTGIFIDGATNTCKFNHCILDNLSAQTGTCIGAQLTSTTADCNFTNCCISSLRNIAPDMMAVMAGFLIEGKKHYIKATEVTDIFYTGSVGAAGIAVGPFDTTTDCCILESFIKDNVSTSMQGGFPGIILGEFSDNTTVRRNILKDNQDTAIINQGTNNIILQNEAQGHQEDYTGDTFPFRRIVGYDPTAGGKFNRAPKEFDNISTFTFAGDDVCCPCISDFQSTWTIIAQLEVTAGTAACDPTPLSQDDVSSGILTINQSGCYCVEDDIVGLIIIDADDVVLDINGKIVKTGFGTGNIIQSTSHDNIIIRNGFILADSNNAANNGIALNMVSNALVSNIVLKGTNANCITVQDSDCIRVVANTVDDVKGIKSELPGDGSSIFVDNSENILVECNTIVSVAGIDPIIISNNFIHILDSTNTVIRKNSGERVSKGIFVETSTCIDILKNTCTNTIKGIALQGSTHCIIQNNITSCNEFRSESGLPGMPTIFGTGIDFVSSTTCTIIDNIAHSNGIAGISLDADSTDNCIAKNICNDNNQGIINDGARNSLLQNKAQENDGGNFTGIVGMPGALLSTFDFSSGTFTLAPSDSFSNLSVTI